MKNFNYFSNKGSVIPRLLVKRAVVRIVTDFALESSSLISPKIVKNWSEKRFRNAKRSLKATLISNLLGVFIISDERGREQARQGATEAGSNWSRIKQQRKNRSRGRARQGYSEVFIYTWNFLHLPRPENLHLDYCSHIS